MAIVLTCPGCENRMRVKDELAGRKVKCPKCARVVVVPLPEPAEMPEEVPPPEPEPARAVQSARPADESEDEEPPPRPKKKKGLLNADVGEMHRSFNNFDVRRFTAVGWLLLVVAVAVAVIGVLLVYPNHDRIMDAILPRRPNEPLPTFRYRVPEAIAAAVGGLGTFFAGWGLMRLLGIRVIRPKATESSEG